MGFFNKKAPADSRSPTHVDSHPPTIVPSENVSNTAPEKEQQTEPVVTDKSSDTTSTSSPKEVEPLPLSALTASPRNSKEEEQQSENEKKIVEEETKEGKEHDGEDEAVYPGGLKLFIITLALCLSVFLVALDNTIIATAIPKITDRFNSLGDVGWYGSSYLLTTCALQLFFGKSVSLVPPWALLIMVQNIHLLFHQDRLPHLNCHL